MSKRLIAGVVCFVFIFVSGLALAEDVYITKSGGKYHVKDCSLIANKDSQAISEQDAQAKGLSLCSRCMAKLQVLAKDEKVDTVCATKSGTKYHKCDCNLIKNRKTSQLPVEDAVKKGLEPCGKCFAKQAKLETDN